MGRSLRFSIARIVVKGNAPLYSTGAVDLLIPALVVSAALVAAALIRYRARPGTSGPPQDAMLASLQGQVTAGLQNATQQMELLRQAVQGSMDTLSGQVGRSLSDTHKAVGDRLDNTARMLGDIRQQMGQLESASRRLVDIGQDIAKLEQILQPPKLRGALGELFLGDLLAQILPSSHYRLQYAFKGGQTVDAVIVLRAGIVPIDAKFPLENFRRIFAVGDEDLRKAAKRAFIRDVKTHVDAIAERYIRMDERTFDFALMYVPAENVYYETIIKDDEFDNEMPLFNYALHKRVIPVSPNSFYAYLQTIILGLKGMQVEERSREIIDDLGRLHKEFDLFAEAFKLLGQHLDNAAKKYAEVQKRFGKLEGKVEAMDSLTRGLEGGGAPLSLEANARHAEP